MEYISKNEAETFSIAENVASKAKAGDIFVLSGNLGSGKTTFVQAFAKALGIKEQITSPTFVLLKQYRIPVSGGKKADFIIHIDCYRMEGLEDANSIGLSEYIKKNNSILMIEWPEKIEKILPSNSIKIKFEYIDEFSRKIKIIK